ncbi:VOC family protein [Aliihoeflea sp. 40Bstr573]|uniref:VOC family protein n=1 Tax=Aliihoeflea sp. 40Bstr573 TaxID=2696467 RepID=UPI0020950BA6|nr:VOC family protein [Aliihoeflea sp. 40Bstr573]MCO6387846.1 VOC family protein [Aliihoeflea sp. 40Bstr573]
MAVKTIHPFLMFQDGTGIAALEFYREIFPDMTVERLDRYGPGAPGPEDTIHRAEFTIAGQTVHATDSFVRHDFDFTPSFSFFVQCGTEDEVTVLADRLKDGGAELMPAGDYGFSKCFAWVNDRFGVSWQVNCD